jgi:hypothetical protein
LRIVPSYDLGSLGPSTGEPVLYHWRWYHNAPGLGLWVVLALALVVPKPNRTWGVLLILVPVLLANGVWLAAALILKPIASDKETFNLMVLSLAVGSAVLWLLGHVLANRTGRRRVVLALGIAWGVALVGMLFVADFSQRALALPSLLGVLMPAMVLGYVWAGRMSRRTYSSTRFILLLAAGMVALSALGVSLWFLLNFAMSSNWPTHLLLTLGAFLLVGAILGACVFLISLPFVLVGLRSPLFRFRLFACLRLPSAAGPADAADAPPRVPGR